MKKIRCPYCKGKGFLEEVGIDYVKQFKCGRCKGKGVVDQLTDSEK